MARRVRLAAMLVIAAAVSAACAGRAERAPQAPATTRGGAQAPAITEDGLPDAVQVVCDTDGTTVLTPTVRPQRDGVHLIVRNTTGVDMGFIVGTGGDNAPVGSSELIWDLAPGTTKIGCVGDQESDRQPDAQVTVEDPDGIWTDPSVGCDDVTQGLIDYAAGAEGDQGDPVDIARARLRDRLQPGDQVAPAGYPEAEEREVIVVRDGSTVAALRYRADGSGGGWLEDSETTCADFGS